ncbi:RNA polymerase sigma factor [Chitinophaga sp. GCM10012297]|uniref:RNA polymerase sigma factor n=1 Tax=Chitinophaga chungangae TaxID=2821488 RepID=A0ABS3YI73_9BACT|nr:RNA polymerase sigma factor [Chitinophaga chungangae]MBO9154339.1 RNA polymerase sigma factor [Chitinophaga chungangae]
MSSESFISLIMPFREKLYRFALRLLGNEEDAKDIIQDAFVKVWNNKDKMGELQNLEAWCMRITRNLALDKIKSRKYRVTDDLERAGEVPAAHHSPHQSAEKSDLMRRVHGAIRGLPEKYRTILQLRDIDGLSYQEIGEVLEIELGEVKVNLHRARKQVREQLQNLHVYGIQ